MSPFVSNEAPDFKAMAVMPDNSFNSDFRIAYNRHSR